MQHPSFTDQLLAIPAKQRKNIKNLLYSKQPMPTLMRSNLNTLWEQFYDLADSNFVSDFPGRLHSRAWEMHLGAALRGAGFKLEARKPGPDFLTYDGETKVWIEAAIAEPGNGPNLVPDAPFTTMLHAPEDKIVLRITNALDNKMKQLKKHIAEGIIGEGDRYVIALCTSIPKHLVSSFDAVRAVYGIGGWQFDRDPRTGEVVGSWLASRREIKKMSGKPVSTDAFLDPAWGRVSGLLLADEPCAVDLSQLGSQFATLHNFTAQFPLRSGWLRFNSEYHIEEKEGVLYLMRSYGKGGSRIPSL